MNNSQHDSLVTLHCKSRVRCTSQHNTIEFEPCRHPLISVVSILQPRSNFYCIEANKTINLDYCPIYQVYSAKIVSSPLRRSLRQGQRQNKGIINLDIKYHVAGPTSTACERENRKLVPSSHYRQTSPSTPSTRCAPLELLST
jgi:hypothetical protein